MTKNKKKNLTSIQTERVSYLQKGKKWHLSVCKKSEYIITQDLSQQNVQENINQIGTEQKQTH